MERSTATSARTHVGLTLPDGVGDLAPARSPGALRFARLRRRLLCADLVAGALSGLLVASLAGMAPAQVALVAALLAWGWPLVGFLCGLYATEDLRTWASGIGEAPKLAVACLLLSWPTYGLASALGAPRPLVAGLGATFATAGAAILARAIARVGAHRLPQLRQRTLLIGSGHVAQQLVERLRRHDELGLEPIGFIDDDAHRPAQLGLPRLGSLDALSELLASRQVDRVMVAFTRASHEDLLRCIRACRDAGVAVDIVPRLFEFLEGARTVDRIGGMPLLSIDAPTFSRPARAAKRALDIAGALTGLVALAPLLIAIAVAIKLDSRGPVLFSQQRAGRGGRFFRLYKFRSMELGSSVLVRDDGAIVKTADDARITRVGRFIRRFSLDEAPQLFNILTGDMSLVGPRPLVVAEANALTESWQARRADLRPGLTGPWQISGRSHLPFPEMIRFDYQYVAGWSLARDVEILLATIPTVLTGRGAY